MFYEVKLPEIKPGQKQAAALVVLNPSESRRLIAKAVVALPEVQNAYKKGMIIIARGISTAFFAEELFGVKIEPKGAFSLGIVSRGLTNASLDPIPLTWHVVKQGKVMEGADSRVEIQNFGPEDVFIKGANALDRDGTPGVFASSRFGGTIGMAWPVITPRGCHLIMPVGLEKMVPSVMEASEHTGIYHFKYSTGIPVKLIPDPLGRVVTEIQAFAVLCGVKATHVGSGGVGGSEGAVVLSLEGEEGQVEKAFELVKTIKGEPPITTPHTYYVSSAAEYNYDASAQLATLKGM